MIENEEGSKESKSWKFTRDCALAEYQALTTESTARIGAMRQVITWSLTLTAALVGAFITLKPNNSSSLLVQLISSEPCDQTLLTSGLLLIGYTLAIEFLICYYIFQAYTRSQISAYVVNLDKRLRAALAKAYDASGDGKIDGGLFEWDRICRKKVPVIAGQPSQADEFWYKLATYLQPVPLYVMAFLGLIGSLAVTIYSVRYDPNTANIVLLIICVLIAGLLIFLGFFHKRLLNLYKLEQEKPDQAGS